MTGENRIIAFGTANEDVAPPEPVESHAGDAGETYSPEWADEMEPAARRDLSWLMPALALAVITVWTALFALAYRASVPSANDMRGWIALISDWATPVVLVCLAWLIAMRSSRREASRFGDAARLLSTESARLEDRLSAVNRELSLAREFIAAQSRDLESLGRVAADRLSQNAEQLRALVHENGERVETLGAISDTALGNMEKLRGQLPVIASSAKDVTNNIGNAGRAAHAQLAELIAGFNRLNEFGQASERQVGSLRTAIDDALAEFEQRSTRFDEISAQRFAALGKSGEAFRVELDRHEVEALGAIRSRAAALIEEIASSHEELARREAEALTSLRARLCAIRDEGGAITRSLRDGEARAGEAWQASLADLRDEIAQTGALIADAETQATGALRERVDELTQAVAALDAQLAERGRGFAEEIEVRRSRAAAALDDTLAHLGERLTSIDEQLAERRTGHERQAAALLVQSETIAARIGEFEQQLIRVTDHGRSAEASLDSALSTLGARLAESSTALGTTGGEIVDLTDASVRLLELLRASAEQTGHELPLALAANEDRLATLEDRVRTLATDLDVLRTSGENLVGLVASSSDGVTSLFSDIERLQASLAERSAEQQGQIAALAGALGDVDRHSEQVSQRAASDLTEAVERLAQATSGALAHMDAEGAATVARLAERLQQESAAAVNRALADATAGTADQIGTAAREAAEQGRDAAIQLRDQLAKVNELVSNLERRVAHARSRAEEQVDNDFSRRAALITESLNSHAVDIARALATDVADTAWASYLKGDRGIFTRRAVALLDTGEAREILQIYERDDQFREHVARYIHDFEAILRQVLSTRDGHALGVTLLSSDMGKLYVALAQAIERLRR